MFVSKRVSNMIPIIIITTRTQNHRYQHHGGAIETVRGSLKSLEFILWGPQLSVLLDPGGISG